MIKCTSDLFDKIKAAQVKALKEDNGRNLPIIDRLPASINMPPYEMLYGRRCRTLVCWDEVGSRELASTDVVLAITEKIQTIREILKAAQDRWKSYANNRRRPIEFNVGDFVMLKVSPWKEALKRASKAEKNDTKEKEPPKDRTKAEEIALCQAWCDVLKNSEKGNSMKAKGFWEAVINYFEKEADSTRGYDSILSK
ncbi:hypothetical protein Tco_0573574 [Tanacetum coccineum]